MFVIKAHTKFHMPSTTDILIIVVKPKAKHRFRMATISFIYLLCLFIYYVYLTTVSVYLIIPPVATMVLNKWMIKHFGEIGRGLHSGKIPAISSKEWGIPGRKSFKKVGALTEIRNGQISSTNLKRYSLTGIMWLLLLLLLLLSSSLSSSRRRCCC
jgi:hypothetical protein